MLPENRSLDSWRVFNECAGESCTRSKPKSRDRYRSKTARDCFERLRIPHSVSSRSISLVAASDLPTSRVVFILAKMECFRQSGWTLFTISSTQVGWEFGFPLCFTYLSVKSAEICFMGECSNMNCPYVSKHLLTARSGSL